jgi:hypothetical protein
MLKIEKLHGHAIALIPEELVLHLSNETVYNLDTSTSFKRIRSGIRKVIIRVVIVHRGCFSWGVAIFNIRRITNFIH